ncbi:hypothetical protein COV24_03505 [candidate division WWE3 bacterium CG10_big_fil_rev_8_21_14_0_10_32_10]|uniref:Uncharacterized protein n=1 Tax=candidate division WWE3 bacterium CG10_big_fil_rev_8_21_14_0_10_32_10 TaxID=1975090 RepID=A0A2H0R9V7_UNCKA|nr:MAG: hypothetical protein COV24_03505 [candidate division WWE3 bacterium CG10_big_fil_rev_8_21_14_0_10_32_10]
MLTFFEKHAYIGFSFLYGLSFIINFLIFNFVFGLPLLLSTLLTSLGTILATVFLMPKTIRREAKISVVKDSLY